ncbi:endolytic transglycosylase MltG [Thermoflexus sp.]|uniref:endolytic transglycosylase MltG n=1 Tax=Thermoflexus sp. TaxID=1969742 RepID=UPI0025E03699|nr:endolytic transglycosylase MltG [Thermoflexus sp.]MCS6962597.1 endolytic transglycosylase MltG [Thermoflexus sp.]MCX7690191.1 endolytic transglycosylase MltG [Thermoflexus sp.]MDW8064073.1 endolytic transglycosylase MltG [Anaerolineae bacterium]MDW8183733.1 endolytic transglycosylase MltG [Anaerolineae bacterium]
MARKRSRRSTWRWLVAIGVVLFFCGAIGAVLVPRLNRPALSSGPELSGSPADWGLGLYLFLRRGDLERPAGTDATPVTFTIHPGQSVMEVAQALEEAGLIRDAFLFRAYVRYHGLDREIEAGEYTLNKTMTIPQIVEALRSGRQAEWTVRVREGLRLEEVAEAIAAQTHLSAQAILEAARDGLRWRRDFPFLADLPPGATLEGYLFPDTYRLARDATAEAMIRRMLENFGRKVTSEKIAGARARGLSLHQVITLASIVEREAVLPEERPLIASVYLNRLTAGMKLDADPTVQYALGYQPDQKTWWKSPLVLEDLQVDSPYNTYRYPGLPPGPIANPGLASIEAVLNPAETDYFYFMADCIKKDGSHWFARTHEEHLRNFRRCQ